MGHKSPTYVSGFKPPISHFVPFSTLDPKEIASMSFT